MENNTMIEIPVDVTFLAELFGVEVRTVQLWASKDGMPKEERGKYDLVKCLMWRVEKLSDKIEELEKGDETLYKLKQHYQRLQNEEKELSIAKQKGELVEYDHVRIAWVGEIKNVTRNIDSMGVRINKAIGGDSITLSKIKKEIDEVKIFISNSDIKLSDEFEEIEPDESKEQ